MTHPVRAFGRMPSAIFFDGTATPPIPGGDYPPLYSLSVTHGIMSKLQSAVIDRRYSADALFARDFMLKAQRSERGTNDNLK